MKTFIIKHCTWNIKNDLLKIVDDVKLEDEHLIVGACYAQTYDDALHYLFLLEKKYK